MSLEQIKYIRFVKVKLEYMKNFGTIKTYKTVCSKWLDFLYKIIHFDHLNIYQYKVVKKKFINK